VDILLICGQKIMGSLWLQEILAGRESARYLLLAKGPAKA